jgi:hypothetical protein
VDALNEPEFHGFVSEQAVAPLSEAFWGCGASQRGDFGSGFTVEFGGSTWALFFVDDVQSEGLVSTTDVEDGTFADFNTGHDVRFGCVVMGKEQDSGAFDDSDAGCAFAGEVLEGTALFFGEFDWVLFSRIL